ncbi:putative metal-dependent hydrolase [soil metagenome]
MLTIQERRSLIDRYREGHAEVVRALDGISADELNTPESPGEWSPRQVVHHLADSEMMSAMRIRLLVAQDHATIQGYDQEAFARTLYYDRPIERSMAAFGAARAVTAEFLDRMSDEDWSSAGTHTESGPFSSEEWLQYYANHAHDHADQIRRARAVYASNH